LFQNMVDHSESLLNTLIKKVREYPRFSKEEIEKFVGWQYMSISMVFYPLNMT